jgi:hypothetical protein
VTGGYASYYEVKYKLTIWDVLDLLEIMTVKESNMNIYQDKLEEKRKR